MRQLLVSSVAKNPHRQVFLFLIFLLVHATAIIAVIFYLGSSFYRQHVVEECIEDVRQMGELYLSGQVENVFFHADAVSQKMFNEEELKEIDVQFNKVFQSLHIIKLKIFSPDRRVVYSNDHNIVGREDTNNPNLEKALKNEITARVKTKDEVTDLAGEKHIQTDVVEIYFPLKINQKTGAFEVYVDLKPHAVRMRRFFLTAGMIILLGVIIVTILLIISFRNLLSYIQQKEQYINRLSEIMPICSICKKIRDEQGKWQDVEVYISHHTESDFTHGICEECMKKHYPDFVK